MKKINFLILFLFFTASAFSLGIKRPLNNESYSKKVSIENKLLKVTFYPKSGKFDFLDKTKNILVFKDALFKFDGFISSDPGLKFTCSKDNNDKTLKIAGTYESGITLLLNIEIGENSTAAVLIPAIINNSGKSLIIKNIYPIADASLYPDQELDKLQLLDGNGGAEVTRVRNEPYCNSRNNLLLTGQAGKKRVSLVMGSLSYEYFEKFASVNLSATPKEHLNEMKLIANLYSADPVGKRLSPGESFTSEKDKFYIDAITADPFISLENYAFALKKEQKINIRHYTFPTVCLWYASHKKYGGEAVGATNDSKGAVEEMESIVKTGFLKYSTAAVRLVPDSYLPNNEQGWWDEAHWQKYGSGAGDENTKYNVKVKGGHYKFPYETTAKWAGAVKKLGGIPLTYFQTGIRSQDYAEAFPGHMLHNQSDYPARNYWPNPQKGTYDFTDPGFIKHMQNVYSNLSSGGVQGLMFDYPRTGWADYGGFEDSTKTTAWAYRNIFKLAHDGLNGDSSLVHERNIRSGSEVALGTIASQRTWGDSDGMTPEMITRSGLRWYKNRVVVNYDTDSKNLIKFREISRDKLRQVLTMVYVTTGRFLIGNSFSLLTKEDVHDLSRVFPFHQTLQSARPVDAFVNYFPTVYDYKVNDSWHLVTLYNTDDAKTDKNFHINLSATNVQGGLNLNPSREYYAYDFWNRKLIGKIAGNTVFNQALRQNEARMIAIHEVQNHPQFISTNRHIMQGYLDLENVQWNESAKELSGTAKVIGGEPFNVVIAGNGFDVVKAMSKDNDVKVNIIQGKAPGIYELEINSYKNQSVNWLISFSKNK